MRNPKSKAAYISIAIIITGMIIVYLFVSEEGNSAYKKILEKVGKSVEDSKSLDNGENGNPSQDIPSKNSGGGSGGKSGGGGSGSQNSESSKCSMNKITYALMEFIEDIKCQEYIDGICINLIANCSMEVHNLDNREYVGNFKVRYTLTDKYTGDELDSHLIEDNIAFDEFKIFAYNFSLSNLEGISENLKCNFKTEEIPRTKVCN